MTTVTEFKLQAGRQKLAFELMTSGSSWTLNLGEMSVMSGWVSDGRVGFDRASKSVMFFEEELMNKVKKSLK